jgi:hypothetical protein
MREGFFGEENWIDEGIEVSHSLPFGTKSILTVAALNGNNPVLLGDGESEIENDNFPVVANVSSIIETDYVKIDLGSSVAYGKWDEENEQDVHLFGLDAGLTVENWNFQGEYMYLDKEQPEGTDDQKGYGYYILGSYTWPIKKKYLDNIELLFAFGRSDPDTGTEEIRYTPQLTFNLTEAAKIRFSYDIRDEKPDNIDNNRFIAQFAYHF